LMMKQARCTWNKHDAQAASTGTRNQASWVEISHTEKAPDTTQRRACLRLMAEVVMTDLFGDG
jgi:hypothetical protein